MEKRVQFLVFILATLLSFSMTAQNLSKKEKRLQKEEKQFELLKEMVAKDSLVIEFDHCNSSGMGYRNLVGNDNSLKLRNDSAYADLPYFGRAYKARMDSKGGIKFEDIRSNEKITEDVKKKKVIMTFEGKDEFDQYKCNLSLYGNGSATLIVISNYYQTISYEGSIKDWDKMVTR